MKELFEYIESFKTKSTGQSETPLWLSIVGLIFICIVFCFGITLLLAQAVGIDIDATDEKGKQKANIVWGIAIVTTIISSIYVVTDVIKEYNEAEAKAKARAEESKVVTK